MNAHAVAEQSGPFTRSLLQESHGQWGTWKENASKAVDSADMFI